MSKELKKYLVSVFIIILAAVVGILCCGKRLTLSFEVPIQAIGGSVTTADESVVKIISSKLENGYMTVCFEAAGRGSSAAHINWEPVDNAEFTFYNIDLSFTTGLTGVIYEKVTGCFTGWRITAAATTLFCFLSAFALLQSFMRRKEKNLFSYSTVLCAGFGIFMLITALFCLHFMLQAHADPSMTIWLMYLLIVSSCQNMVVYISPLLALFSLLLFISNLSLVRHEGFEKSNISGFALAVLILSVCLAGIKFFGSSVNVSVRNAVSTIFSSIFCYLACILFAVILCTLKAARHSPAYDKDFILIPGCKIAPDGSLFPMIRARVDRAIEFAAMQEKLSGKRAMFVPCGGKRAGESISEAEAMARYLRQQGIDDERILIEKTSVNIWENMCCSKKLIETRRKNASVVFSTSNYNVFRSGILARDAGWSPDGMGVPCKWYFWPNAFIKEFTALLASKFWIHISVITVFIVIFTALALTF